MAKLRWAYYKDGLKTVVFYLKPHKREVTFLGVLSVILAMADAVIPYLGGKLFDAILGKIAIINFLNYSLNPFVAILSVWIVVELTANIFQRYKDWHQEKLTALLESDYIVFGLGRLLRFPLSFHKQKKIGEIIDRITRAGGWLQNIVGRMLIDLTPQFISIFLALAITFSIQPMLASLLLLAIAMYVFILFRTAPHLSGLSREMHKAYSRAYGDAYDSVLNINSVKQATAENFEKRKLYRNFNLRAAKIWTDYIRISANMNFSQKVLVTITRFTIFAFSIYLISVNKLTPGELLAFNGYAAMIFGPFAILGRNWDLVQNGFAAISRAEKVLSLPEETYVPENAVILRDVKGGIEFKNVSFRYERNKNLVLKNISLTVDPGESIALVGESGVGKSTLIDLLSFYYEPSVGSIYIDGHNLKTVDLVNLRSAIAVVPQEIILFNDTVKNNIRYGRFGASDSEVERAAKLAHADEFIKKFPKKYEQIVGERGVKLSVGQKQRIAIARAILRNPRILILDEPTSALDAKSEKFITESLEELMRGRTTFIIAHRLSTVRRADRIIVLDEGRIVEMGTHEELITKPNGVYKKLYDLQMGLK